MIRWVVVVVVCGQFTGYENTNHVPNELAANRRYTTATLTWVASLDKILSTQITRIGIYSKHCAIVVLKARGFIFLIWSLNVRVACWPVSLYANAVFLFSSARWLVFSDVNYATTTTTTTTMQSQISSMLLLVGDCRFEHTARIPIFISRPIQIQYTKSVFNVISLDAIYSLVFQRQHATFFHANKQQAANKRLRATNKLTNVPCLLSWALVSSSKFECWTNEWSLIAHLFP